MKIIPRSLIAASNLRLTDGQNQTSADEIGSLAFSQILDPLVLDFYIQSLVDLEITSNNSTTRSWLEQGHLQIYPCLANALLEKSEQSSSLNFDLAKYQPSSSADFQIDTLISSDQFFGGRNHKTDNFEHEQFSPHQKTLDVFSRNTAVTEPLLDQNKDHLVNPENLKQHDQFVSNGESNTLSNKQSQLTNPSEIRENYYSLGYEGTKPVFLMEEKNQVFEIIEKQISFKQTQIGYSMNVHKDASWFDSFDSGQGSAFSLNGYSSRDLDLSQIMKGSDALEMHIDLGISEREGSNHQLGSDSHTGEHQSQLSYESAFNAELRKLELSNLFGRYINENILNFLADRQEFENIQSKLLETIQNVLKDAYSSSTISIKVSLNTESVEFVSVSICQGRLSAKVGLKDEKFRKVIENNKTELAINLEKRGIFLEEIIFEDVISQKNFPNHELAQLLHENNT
ncbi:MAG: hypothetical protein NZO16_00580 [Deltaproteobacteria bacterium]|nr:hypothetical protein [Deltaproteobacteria bacterium]